MRISDSCRVIDFRLFVLRSTAFAEPGRSHWVMPKDFATISSPPRSWLQRILGFVAARRLTRHERLLALRFRSTQLHTYSFFQTLPHGFPNPFRFPDRPGAPSQCPCSIGVGFPSSGLRDRTYTFRCSPPIFWPCQSHGLRPLRGLRPGLCCPALSALAKALLFCTVGAQIHLSLTRMPSRALLTISGYRGLANSARPRLFSGRPSGAGAINFGIQDKSSIVNPKLQLGQRLLGFLNPGKGRTQF
jgi:hypothetical protein